MENTAGTFYVKHTGFKQKFYNTFIKENRGLRAIQRMRVYNFAPLYQNHEQYIKQQFPWNIVKEGDTVLQIASSSTTLPQGISQPMLLRVAVGNSGRVVVVEPFKPSIEFVKSYAEFNKLKNIEFHNNAIWKTKGKVEFLYRPEMPSWNRIDAVAQDYKDSNWKQPFDSQAIEAETIDNIIKKSNIDIKKLSLINMTINGGEFDALAGAENALANEVSFSFPVQNELTARSGIIDFFINRGYSVYLQHAPVAKKQEQFLVALATKKKVSFESDKVSVQVYNKGTAARFKITIDKSNKVLSENDFKKSYCWF